MKYKLLMVNRIIAMYTVFWYHAVVDSPVQWYKYFVVYCLPVVACR